MSAKTNTLMQAVNPADASELIRHCVKVQQPVMVWGPPGIGKSDIVAGIAAEQGRPLIDMRLVLMESTDLRGIPYHDPVDGAMKWAPPAELPRAGFKENAILFLDEINAAPPSVQAAAYQLLLNRKIGEYTLPDGVSMVCAGNDEGDRGVTYRMPTPLLNRLTHIVMQSSYADWRTWALQNNVNPAVIGYLEDNQSSFHRFDAKSSEKAFPTPRSWCFVSRLLDEQLGTGKSQEEKAQDLINDIRDQSDKRDRGDKITEEDSGKQRNLHMIRSLVAGSVGPSDAITFMSFWANQHRLPKTSEVFKGTATLDRSLGDLSPSALYSLVFNCCMDLKQMFNKLDTTLTDAQIKEDPMYKKVSTSVDNLIEFTMKKYPDGKSYMSPEMQVLTVRLLFKDFAIPTKVVRICPAYTKFTLENSKRILQKV